MTDIESLIRSIVREELSRATPANDPPAEYLSTSEAAAFARVSVYTIRRWVKSGELTRHEAGARVLVRRDELERFMKCAVTPIDSHLSPAERARRRFG